jgi:hypothetical protein
MSLLNQIWRSNNATTLLKTRWTMMIRLDRPNPNRPSPFSSLKLIGRSLWVLVQWRSLSPIFKCNCRPHHRHRSSCRVAVYIDWLTWCLTGCRSLLFVSVSPLVCPCLTFTSSFLFASRRLDEAQVKWRFLAWFSGCFCSPLIRRHLDPLLVLASSCRLNFRLSNSVRLRFAFSFVNFPRIRLQIGRWTNATRDHRSSSEMLQIKQTESQMTLTLWVDIFFGCRHSVEKRPFTVFDPEKNGRSKSL